RDRRRHNPPHQEPEPDEPVRSAQPPAPREPVSLPVESGRPARIAPVSSITPERPSMEKNAPVIMPKVVS
ncbi:cell division protein SepF, partial [Streptomyces sp. SID11233]|nr:cell division protein SepF [Streptomyces sp. SID11233]